MRLHMRPRDIEQWGGQVGFAKMAWPGRYDERPTGIYIWGIGSMWPNQAHDERFLGREVEYPLVVLDPRAGGIQIYRNRETGNRSRTSRLSFGRYSDPWGLWMVMP
jgi:hypothetical protein